LGLRIQFHSETSGVVARLRTAKSCDTARNRIPVRSGFSGTFAQFVNDVGGRGQVWVAHCQIDYVATGSANHFLDAIYRLEDIGWKALYCVERQWVLRDLVKIEISAP
jgi:hypothetical protein